MTIEIKKTDRNSIEPDARPSLVPGSNNLTPQVLLQRFGRAPDKVVATFVRGVAPGALLTEGRRIGTARIVRDGARIIQAAGNGVAKASDAQRTLLPMVTGQFLSASATALAVVDERRAAHDQRKKSVARTKKTSEARAETLQERAKGTRKTFRSALVTAACGDVAWIARVEEAAGKGSEAVELSDSLTGLVGVGRELRARLEANGLEHALTDEYFTTVTRLADQVRTAVSAVDLTSADETVGPGDVKRADGVCLWFLKRLVEAFDAAHASDPSIERLQVYSLRSVLRRSGRKRKPSAAKPAEKPAATKPAVKPAPQPAVNPAPVPEKSGKDDDGAGG